LSEARNCPSATKVARNAKVATQVACNTMLQQAPSFENFCKRQPFQNKLQFLSVIFLCLSFEKILNKNKIKEFTELISHLPL